MIAPVIADNLKTAGIFSVGNTIDPAEAYRNFRGRDPRVEALMKKRVSVLNAAPTSCRRSAGILIRILTPNA
jgi:hypothetical protein